MLLWLKYIKHNNLTDICTVPFLLVFSNNCGYSALILYPNLASGSFLNVRCHVKLETVSMYFLNSITLNSTGLS